MKANSKKSDSRTGLVVQTAIALAFAGLIMGASIPAVANDGKPPVQWTMLGAFAGLVIFPIVLMQIARILAKNNPLGLKQVRLRISLAAAISALPMFWYLPFPYFGADPATHPDVPSLLDAKYVIPVILMLVVVMSAILTSIFIREPARKKSAALIRIENSPMTYLFLMIGVWIIFSVTMDILKHHNLYVLGSNTSTFNQSLANIFSDRGVMYNTNTQTFGSSLLGVHMNIVFFFVYPFYLVLPGYETIITLGTICLGLGALPVYLLAKRHFSIGISLLLAATYLVHPSIIGQAASQDMSELRFVALPLLFAFYFFESGRFGPFMLFSVLAMTVREDVSIFICIFGILALFRRRGIHWILVPVIAGGAWFLAAVTLAIPAFNPKGKFVRLAVYSPLGSNVKEIALTFVLRPWKVLGLAFSSMRHLGFVVQVFQSTGLLAPFFSAAIILAIPAMGENLLHFARPNIVWYYAILLIATMFPAMILGFARIRTITEGWTWWGGQYVALVLMVLTFFSSASMFYEWLNPVRFHSRPNIAAIEQIMNRLPDDASVVMPSYLLDLAKPTQETRSYFQVHYEFMDNVLQPREDYVIIDSEIVSSEENRHGRQELETMMKETGYILLEEDNNLSLYQKPG